MEEKLWRMIEPALATDGYEIADLEFASGQRGGTLRLYLDHPDRPITLEDCEQVSRNLGTLLDVEDPIDRSYSLEVSSPGINRPLRQPKHWKRFVGQPCKVKTSIPLDDQRNFKGTLASFDDEDQCISLETDRGLVRIRLDQIRKAGLDLNLEDIIAKQPKK